MHTGVEMMFMDFYRLCLDIFFLLKWRLAIVLLCTLFFSLNHLSHYFMTLTKLPISVFMEIKPPHHWTLKAMYSAVAFSFFFHDHVPIKTLLLSIHRTPLYSQCCEPHCPSITSALQCHSSVFWFQHFNLIRTYKSLSPHHEQSFSTSDRHFLSCPAKVPKPLIIISFRYDLNPLGFHHPHQRKPITGWVHT